MKNLLVLLVLLFSLNGFSQTTKAQRYEAYKLKCNAVDTVVIKETGYLKLDTLVLSKLPTKSTYYGKVIINSIKVSPTRSLIVTVDTIWNKTTFPVYAYGNTTKVGAALPYEKNPNRWVFRDKKVIIKLCKPVSYTTWTKNEAYYDELIKTVTTSLNLK